MKRVVTITFSPCIDKSTSVTAMISEKKLKCALPKLEPGGGGINVARAIHKLGGNSIAMFPAGGYTGNFFIELLRKENVPSLIVKTKEETRENIIILDEATNQQYRFCMPGNPLEENEWKEILYLLECMEEIDVIVASGSLPPGVPQDVFAQIALIAKNKKVKFIVDTSGKALKYAIAEGVYLVKPNLAELSYLAGKEFLHESEIPAVALQILSTSKCEAIMVSLGSEGALLVTKAIVKKIVPPPVKKVSTVGAGDSMVAGIVFALSRNESLETAAEYGVACGTAATLSPGTGLCKLDDVKKLFAIIKKSATEETTADQYFHNKPI
ncbi:MAG: 1-phosphofructokinase family hexose kinase [Bacteroidetes bacterium]|nr:1-phosphofructokinase family hexose kinase [Bacteroidota bacterium]MBS1607450.1 1-phosphofructokinase family hexose kinase [Bacteroidota bacterium]